MSKPPPSSPAREFHEVTRDLQLISQILKAATDPGMRREILQEMLSLIKEADQVLELNPR